MDNLKEVRNNPKHIFIGDICDRELVRSIFEDYDIRGVIHFAAESHVDNSIANPDIYKNKRKRHIYTDRCCI